MSDVNEAVIDRPPRRLGPLIAIPVLVVIAVLVIVLATQGENVNDSPRNHLVGQAAPELVGTTIDGATFDIDDHRGQWVVVNFFSTTCVPCVVEHPELVAFSERHKASGDAVVVSVAFADTAKNVTSFFEQKGGDWPVLVENTDSIAVDYAVLGVPESFIVAPSGQVAGLFTGGVESAELDAFIGNRR